MDSRDNWSEDEYDQSYLGPKFIFNHRLTRTVKPNSIIVSGWGVESIFGRIMISEKTCKVFFKHRVSLDYLHKISQIENDVKVVFMIPGRRKPVGFRFKTVADPINSCLVLKTPLE